MLELKPINITSVAIPFDYEKTREDLIEGLKKYQGFIVSDNKSIKEARDNVAKLNSLVKTIEDERKKVKKIVNAGYNEFEGQIKELVALINEPISNIKDQLNIIDEEEIKEKKIEIEKIFNESEITQYCTLKDVYNLKWENKTYKLTEIKREINDKLNDIKNKLNSIELIYKDDIIKQNALKIKYMKHFDLDKAVNEYNQELELKAKIDSGGKGTKEPTYRTKEKESINRLESVQPLSNQEKQVFNANIERKQLYSLDLRLVLSKDDADLLYKLLKENNINFKALGKAVKVNRLFEY